MSYFLTIIVFVVVFSALILIHELGHFVMARRAGIKVEEFGIGLPPRIWGKKRGETIYSVNLIPFGGFVRMLGEDAVSPKMLKEKRSFIAATPWNRIKVTVAGVVMNFFLAWVLLSVALSVGMQPLLLPTEVLNAVKDGTIVLENGIAEGDSAEFPRVEVFDGGNGELKTGDFIIAVNGEQIFDLDEMDGGTAEVYREGKIINLNLPVSERVEEGIIIARALPDYPALEAGLSDGDIVLSVDGKNFLDPAEMVKYVSESHGKEMEYLIERDGLKVSYTVKAGDDGRIGVLLSSLVNYDGATLYNSGLVASAVEIKEEKYSPHVAVYKAFGETFHLAALTAKMFVGFIGNLIGSGEIPETVTGPVGIFRYTYGFVQEGIIPVIRFVAILSLSLAAINILPLPALDGGRLLFILFEVVTRKKVNQKMESIIHMVGYALLLLILLAVTFNDILNWVNG